MLIQARNRQKYNNCKDHCITRLKYSKKIRYNNHRYNRKIINIKYNNSNRIFHRKHNQIKKIRTEKNRRYISHHRRKNKFYALQILTPCRGYHILKCNHHYNYRYLHPSKQFLLFHLNIIMQIQTLNKIKQTRQKLQQ